MVDSFRLRSAPGYKPQTTACFCPGARALGSDPTEPDGFAQWFHSVHEDHLFSSCREQAAVEHSCLHDGVCMAVCCLLVCDAPAGVGRIRLRTPSDLLHPGLQQRGQVKAGARSHRRGGGECHPLGWPGQHSKVPQLHPVIFAGCCGN